MRLRWRRNRNHHSERGATMLVFALMLVVLLGFAAMVSDAGMAFWNRRLLQNAVDGAALAGAAYLPDDATAKAVAREYARKNGVDDLELVEVTTATQYHIRDYGVPVALTVTAQRRFDYGLRYIVGAGNVNIVASATAIIAPGEPANLWPFGVLAGVDCTVECTLKVAPNDQTTGNFGFVDFDGPGGGQDEVKNRILGNYQPGDAVGDGPPWSWKINTETGNKSKVTEAINTLFAWDSRMSCDGEVTVGNCGSLYKAPPVGEQWYPEVRSPDRICNDVVECPRVGIVPKISEVTWPNGRKEVTAVDFTCVYILRKGDVGNEFEIVFRDVGQCFSSLNGTEGDLEGDLDSSGRRVVFLWR